MDKDFGIKGFKINAEFLKSRSNEAGNRFELIYHQQTGYHNELTNFNFLKGLGLLKGNGRAYYFAECPDVKFTQKNFLDKLHENANLKEVFDTLVKTNMAEFLSQENSVQSSFELVTHIEGNIYLANDGLKYEYDEESGNVTCVE